MKKPLPFLIFNFTRYLKRQNKKEEKKMNKETLKKIFLPLIVLVIIIQIWSGIATYIPGFPTPSDTYVYAFGGTTGGAC